MVYLVTKCIMLYEDRTSNRAQKLCVNDGRHRALAIIWLDHYVAESSILARFSNYFWDHGVLVFCIASSTLHK